MQKKLRRLFVFGCSFSSGLWASVADFAAVNFDQTYSFAGPAQSNPYNVSRFFELLQSGRIDLDSGQDHVVFQTTGWGRFGYWSGGRQGHWQMLGDLFGARGQRPHPYPEEAFEPRQAVYTNWAALASLASVRQQLTRPENLTVVRGMDFVELWDPELGLGLGPEDLGPVLELDQQFDSGPSIWHHCLDLRGGDPSTMWKLQFQDGHEDAHPYIDECWQYVEQYLPDWATPRAREFRDRCHQEFGWQSADRQGQQYQRLRREYRIERIHTTDHLWMDLTQLR